MTRNKTQENNSEQECHWDLNDPFYVREGYFLNHWGNISNIKYMEKYGLEEGSGKNNYVYIGVTSP